MYEPASFRVEDKTDLIAFVRAYPLGLIVANGADGMSADLIPLLIDDAGQSLRGHCARQNPLSAALAVPQEVLVVFTGPNAYISPSLYPSKQEHGRVVPTWNYVMVQARGMARLREDDAWLATQLDDITAQQEAGRQKPWAPGDSPEDYLAAQKRAIAGLEVEIAELRGKYKISQNRTAADREGVLRGLPLEASREAQEMAEFIGSIDERAGGSPKK